MADVSDREGDPGVPPGILLNVPEGMQVVAGEAAETEPGGHESPGKGVAGAQ